MLSVQHVLQAKLLHSQFTQVMTKVYFLTVAYVCPVPSSDKYEIEYIAVLTIMILMASLKV